MGGRLDGMLETSARLLRLLSLLQSRRDWTGAELASRLDVGLRTVRRDVDRLRDLGYPVDAAPGVAGGYRLGVGAAAPGGRGSRGGRDQPAQRHQRQRRRTRGDLAARADQAPAD